MRPPDKRSNGKDKPTPRQTLTEQARKLVEEYINDLREIIEKLRKLQ